MFRKLSGNLVVKLKDSVQKRFRLHCTRNSLAFGLFSDEFQTIQAEIWLNYDYLPQQSHRGVKRNNEIRITDFFCWNNGLIPFCGAE